MFQYWKMIYDHGGFSDESLGPLAEALSAIGEVIETVFGKMSDIFSAIPHLDICP